MGEGREYINPAIDAIGEELPGSTFTVTGTDRFNEPISVEGEIDEKLILDPEQLKAVAACCDISNRVVAVTGSAGTGKTTILQNVYQELRAQNISVVLCAPTGKAAKRITEATGIPAQTIHRLLEYPHPGERDPKTGKTLRTTDPKRDRNSPLDYKVVLCDEYAMVNVEVHRNLFDALPTGGAIRMFGDANQLQPIETNKALARDDSSFIKMLGKFDGIRLETIHRQAGDSNIITNGARIINGGMPVRSDDFTLKITEQPVQVILDYVTDSLDTGHDFGSITSQIISPTKVGWVGSEALNSSIQQMLQPVDKYFRTIDRHKWSKVYEQRIYVGDKVIFTVNNYGLEIFNGETGLVCELNDNGSIMVDFGDRIAEVPVAQDVEGRRGTITINPQMDLDLAYVITTHKAQGSEYDRVCYIMNRSRSYLLNRKNFYTAISRARKHVHIITDSKSLELSLAKKGDKT
jgi:exodeoxyribonuclease V alpha subunit